MGAEVWDLPEEVGAPQRGLSCRLLGLLDQFLSSRDWKVGPWQLPSPRKHPYLAVGSCHIPGNGTNVGAYFLFFNLFFFFF